MKPLGKPKLRQYGGLFQEGSKVWEQFQKSESKPKEVFLPKAERKKQDWTHKLKDHKQKVKEEYKNCKN